MRNYKLLEITEQYDTYLRQFYKSHVGYEKLSYDELYNLLMDDGFAEADFIHRHLKNIGVESKVVFYNNKNLQRIWRTACADKSPWEILLMQIKDYNPDVILVAGVQMFDEEQLKVIKETLLPKKIKLVGTYFSLMSEKIENICNMYDQIYTGSRCYREYFKNLGLPVFLLRHAFETSIFDKLPIASKKKEVCLNGSILFNVHNSRLDILNEFNRDGIPYTYYGTISGRIEDLMLEGNTNYLKILNDIRPRINKPVFGMEYYHTLNMHEICVNAHYKYNYDHPLNAHGGNIRMFEVTGVGSCLLTDSREEIAELFDVDKEIVVYHSMEELLDKAKWLLNNPKKVKEIAMAGQKRTFRDHNYRRKAEQFNEYIQELLK